MKMNKKIEEHIESENKKLNEIQLREGIWFKEFVKRSGIKWEVDKETMKIYKELSKTRDIEQDMVHFRSKVTKKGMDIDINELMDLLQFVIELKKDKDEMTEMYIKRYENANPKKGRM